MGQVDTLKAVPPQFTMRLRDRRVEVSYPVRLTCQIAAAPAPKLTWLKDDIEIRPDGRYSFSTDDNFQTLEIGRTDLRDSGVYTIVAKNEYGTVSCKSNLVVDQGIRAYVPPEFKNKLEASSVELHEGEELRLSGKIEAYPIVGVVWYRDGVRRIQGLF